MIGLSEKAKGKQRAVDPNLPEPSSTPAPSSRKLTIRFTDGVPDLILKVEGKDSVRDVKQQIRAARPQLAKRRLRLIHTGRILTNGVILFDWLATLEKRQQRVTDVNDDAESHEDGTVSSNNTSSTPTWLHCSVGATLEDGEEEDEARKPESQIKPLRGFDRLAAAGFSEDDIASFRRTFHSQSSSDYLDREVPGDDEDYDEHVRVLEEQWIDSLDTAGTASISQSSTTTVLQGLLVGFFFPFIPFFFLREPHRAVFWEDGHEEDRPDSVIFSKRMQMSIVVGFMINLTFGMFRYLLSA
ncbi:hypothetical protein BD410DRAFT_794037 [Rickenella mellea]|uniref:Ubiquitin-like domain-containing protein n=1 Tax=Rickenella mellea TaxID=50990 RepID=A0A4Y7PRM1_9AGAM|nr:hypothetical protein BD410DRAFT_794037 [Rickenella mellea]